MSEQQLSQAELGRALGLSKAAVTKLKKMGMPVDSVDGALRWRAANLNVAARKRQAQVVGSPVGAGSAAVPAAARNQDGSHMPGAAPDEVWAAARARREVAEANLAEMKEAEQQGQLIRVDAVKAVWARRLAATREALLQIPIRVAPVLAAESSIEQVSILLDAEIRQALAEVSGSALPVARVRDGAAG